METHVIITFLPTVLMQLFEVLTAAAKEAHEIAVNSLRSAKKQILCTFTAFTPDKRT